MSERTPASSEDDGEAALSTQPWRLLVESDEPPASDGTEGEPLVRQFAVVPSHRRPRWLIPVDSRGYAAAAASLPIPRQPALEVRIAEMVGHEVRLAIQARPADDIRATVTMAAVSEQSGLEMFVRMAVAPSGEAQVRREAATLQKLEEIGVVHGSLRWIGEIAGRLTALRDPVHGRPSPAHWTAAHQAFIDTMRHGAPRSIADSAFVSELRGRVAASSQTREFSGALDEAIEALRSVEAQPVINHRDFAPWNAFVTDDGTIACIDWESAEIDGIPHLDRFSFDSAIGVNLLGWDRTALSEHARVWLMTSNLDLPGPQVRALGVLLLLDRITWRFEQDQVPLDGDTMIDGCTDALRRLIISDVQTVDGHSTSPATDSDYAQAFQSDADALEYDSRVYGMGTYDDFVWAAQRDLIRQLFRDIRGARGEFAYLDFACGTGRILAAVEDLTTEATGLDISAHMLEAARPRVSDAALVAGDILADPAILDGDFDIITAFRFFLNAEPALRDQVMTALAGRLRDRDSRLIFNVHGSARSVRRLAVRGRRGSFMNEMSPAEIRELVERAGLEVVSVTGFGVTPARLHRTPLRRLVRAVDRLAARLPLARYISIDLIYVTRPATRSDS